MYSKVVYKTSVGNVLFRHHRGLCGAVGGKYGECVQLNFCVVVLLYCCYVEVSIPWGRIPVHGVLFQKRTISSCTQSQKFSHSDAQVFLAIRLCYGCGVERMRAGIFFAEDNPLCSTTIFTRHLLAGILTVSFHLVVATIFMYLSWYKAIMEVLAISKRLLNEGRI